MTCENFVRLTQGGALQCTQKSLRRRHQALEDVPVRDPAEYVVQVQLPRDGRGAARAVELLHDAGGEGAGVGVVRRRRAILAPLLGLVWAASGVLGRDEPPLFAAAEDPVLPPVWEHFSWVLVGGRHQAVWRFF